MPHAEFVMGTADSVEALVNRNENDERELDSLAP